MEARRFTMLSDGIIKMDAGVMFGRIAKPQWEDQVSTDRRNRLTMGLNCVLTQFGGHNVLIDTGVGHKDPDGRRDQYGLVPSRLLKDLRAMGLSPKDIDTVILSRLDFDHCGGCTRLDRAGNFLPTFSRATYYIQETCYEDALTPDERFFDMYREEDFLPIQERGQFAMLNGDYEIMPGVEVKVAGGPCRGHQIVLLTLGGERACYLGDLAPTPFHLDLACIPAFDRYPELTLQTRREVLNQAEEEGWLLLFAHGGPGERAGYLERRNGRRRFRPVGVDEPPKVA